jgi:hypothetical protein
MHRTIAIVFAVAFLLAAVIVEPASADVGTENTWTTKAPMSQARGELGVATVNGKIYAIGGCNSTNFSQTNIIITTNEKYDPVTNIWVSRAPMPRAMWSFAIAAYKDKIYCFGNGLTQVYDPAADSWENKTAMPTSRDGVQANVLGDKIYIVGGDTDSPTNINEVYDPQTDTWGTRAPLPTPVERYASAVFDGKLYVFGGGKAYLNLTLGNITQIYNPKTDSWSYGSPSPLITDYAQAVATTGVNAPPKIYLFDAYMLGLPSGQMYDPDTDSWSVGVAQPTQRMDFGLAVVDDLIYAIGGITHYEDQFGKETNTPFALNEVFTPFGYGTVHVTPSPTPVQSETPQPTASATPIANDEQLQASAIVAVAVVVVVAVGVGLVVYFRKRKS